MAVQTVLVVIAAGLVLPRVLALAFLMLSHLYFAQWTRAVGRRVPISGVALLAYWWTEASAMLTLARQHLWPRRAGFDRVVEGSRPVLLVHGFTQNASNFHRLREAIEDRLGRPTVAVTLGWPMRHDLDGYVPALQRALRRMHDAAGPAGFDVVAHSMGGLITRIALEQAPDLGARLRTVVTIGSPHNGTAGARGPVWGADARSMREKSERLSTLAPLRVLVPGARRVFLAARQDYVVYPTETSFETDAECITLPRPGHAGLLVEPSAIQAVLEVLGADRGAGDDPRDV